MKIKPFLTGLASYVPGLYNRYARGTGGTNSASYCYGIWIKHLTLLGQSGLHEIPNAIAELGPGDSLGVGLAALLSGVNEYYAFDIRKYTNTEKNLKILDELVELFRAHAGTPDKNGFPDIKPYLNSAMFPSHILTEDRLRESLRGERINAIRHAISNLGSDNKGLTEKISIRYIVPWNDPKILAPHSVDLIYSQSVLEHVDMLEAAYQAMSFWLKPGGYMSHQIDFRSHNLTKEWNGHWACNEFVWKIAQGKKSYLLNRQPCSVHLDFLRKHGFKIISSHIHADSSGITRTQLATRWRNISDSDLHCAGILVQVVH